MGAMETGRRNLALRYRATIEIINDAMDIQLLRCLMGYLRLKQDSEGYFQTNPSE